MRHARARRRARPSMGLAIVGLGASAIAGFAFGGFVMGPDQASDGVVMASGASGGLSGADEPLLELIEEPPADAGISRVIDGVVADAELVIEASEIDQEPILGEDEIDPDWPADTRGDGCTAPVWPAKAEKTPRILLIGDSLFRNARDYLESQLTEAGWAPTVRCWGAQGSVWGVGQVERARELDQLPDTVVVSLGTNDIWWLSVSMEDAIDSMMAALGPDITVYWVNLWFGPNNYDRLPEAGPANEVLEAKAAEYPNLRIIDFASAFVDAETRGVPVGWIDGVHLNESARIVRVQAISDALNPYSDAA